LNSRDPKIECRKLLVGWALVNSDYTVMMVPPFPEQDWTGLRGLQGISGELWEHRVELVQTYEPLRDITHGVSYQVNKTAAADAILVLATQAGYLVNMANTARIGLDDYHHDLDLDWFHPMRYSFRVWAENQLRKLIALPTSDDEDMAALLHSSMMADVIGGSRFPDVTFRERYRDRIKEGSLSLPRFKAREDVWSSLTRRSLTAL
jgi:hypothetical protein